MVYNKEDISFILDRLEEPFDLRTEFCLDYFKTYEKAMATVCYRKLINIKHYLKWCVEADIDLEEEKPFIMLYLDKFFAYKYNCEDYEDVKAEIRDRIYFKGYESITEYIHKKLKRTNTFDFFRNYRHLGVTNTEILLTTCEDLELDLYGVHWGILRNSWERLIDNTYNKKLMKKK